MRDLPGINIQWPWSDLLISGAKTVETRTYPIPKKYMGIEIAVIETPGKLGGKQAGIKRARIIGTIVFGNCIEYENQRQWDADRTRHCVSQDNKDYAWNNTKRKYGWEVQTVRKFERPMDAPKIRGIVFAKTCKVES